MLNKTHSSWEGKSYLRFPALQKKGMSIPNDTQEKSKGKYVPSMVWKPAFKIIFFLTGAVSVPKSKEKM